MSEVPIRSLLLNKGLTLKTIMQSLTAASKSFKIKSVSGVQIKGKKKGSIADIKTQILFEVKTLNFLTLSVFSMVGKENPSDVSYNGAPE